MSGSPKPLEYSGCPGLLGFPDPDVCSFPIIPGRLRRQVIAAMRAIDYFDAYRGATDRKQVPVTYNHTGRICRRFPGAGSNLFSVDVSTIAATQIRDLNHRRMDIQLAMVTRNELISCRSR